MFVSHSNRSESQSSERPCHSWTAIQIILSSESQPDAFWDWGLVCYLWLQADLWLPEIISIPVDKKVFALSLYSCSVCSLFSSAQSLNRLILKSQMYVFYRSMYFIWVFYVITISMSSCRAQTTSAMTATAISFNQYCTVQLPIKYSRLPMRSPSHSVTLDRPVFKCKTARLICYVAF